MKELKIIILAALTLFVLSGCREKKPEWQEFSPDTSFSVMMPAEPKEAGFKFSDEDEEIQFHVYKAKFGTHRFKVMTSNVIEESDIEDLMDIGFEMKVGKLTIEERDVDYNGYPGKEFITVKPRSTSITRYFILGDKFYLLSVRYRNKHLEKPVVETFFNSFTVHDLPPVPDTTADSTAG